MSDFFKNVKLNDSEQLWLTELYEFYKRREFISPSHLKRKLFSKLDKSFDPQSIDGILVKYGYQLTPLGILFIDPDSKILERIDHVLRGLKKLFLNNFKRDQFPVEDILKALELPNDEFSIILDLIKQTASKPFQSIFEVADLDQKGRGLDFRSNEIIEEIINYESIEKFVEEKILSSNKLNQEKQLAKGTENAVIKPLLSPYPIFHSVVEQVDRKLCFVLMPFSEEWSDRVYYKLIRKVVDDLGFQCLRADNLTGQIIIEDIWIKINQCAFVIADVTTINPNVMYELGIAHTLRKPFILITQNLSSIPFDFKHLRHHEYKDNIEGFNNLLQKLPQVIREMYKESYPEDFNIMFDTTQVSAKKNFT